MKNQRSIKRTALALTIILSMLLMMVNPAYAADTSAVRPSGTADVNSVTNVSNAYDGSLPSFATYDSSSDRATFTNFNFGTAIASGDIIDSVKVVLYGSHDSNSRQLSVSVSANGSAFSAAQTTAFTTTGASYNFTGATSLWGLAWTAENFINKTFKVKIAGTSGGNNAYLGDIAVIVSYHTPITYTIDASAGTGGTITPNGTVNLIEHANQTFTIPPSTGYIVADVLVDGASQGRINSYSFNNVTANHTIAASFEGGWTQPTHGSGDDLVGGDSTYVNAYSSNDSYAVFNENGDYATYYGFGNLVPANAIINGITVGLEGHRHDGNDRWNVDISIDGGDDWNLHTSGAVGNYNENTGTDSTIIAGSATDNWGYTSWTPALINSHDFRIRLLAQGSPNNLALDQIQVKVSYTIPQVTVTFDKNGGTTEANPTSITTNIDTTVTLPTPPTKTGYTFAGWETSGGTVFNGSTVIHTSLTVYAQWTPNQNTPYLVEHYTASLGGGWTLEETDTNLAGTTGTLATASLNSYPGFSPPATAPTAIIAADGSTVIIVEYTRNSYTIDFNSMGGTEIAPMTRPYGTSLTAPADPTKTGYTFAYWTPEMPAIMPAADMTLVASWNINSYILHIDYVMADGSTAPSDYNELHDYNDPYSINSPSVAGYTPDIAIVAGTMPADDVTVTVTYTANTDTPYIVEHYTENLGGGWTLEGTDYTNGTTNTEAVAILRSFDGFTAPTVAPTAIIAGDGSTVIRVEYTRKSFTISFNSHGGTDVDPITELYGASVSAPTNPTRTGFTFAYWTPVVPSTMPAEDITLDASWYINKTVTKVWVDDDNAAGIRALSVVVQLYQNSIAYGDPVTLDADGSWSHAYAQLPELDAAGDPYTYTIGEISAVPGYTTAYDQTDLTITNTIVKNHIEIVKLDQRDGTTRLPGAVFDLFAATQDGDTWYPMGEALETGLTTGSNGTVTTEGAYAPGYYLLVETTAPTGFHLADPVLVYMEVGAGSDGILSVDVIDNFDNNPDISIIKQVANFTRLGLPADLTELYAGETARYTVTVTNNGNVKLTDVTLTDSLAVPGSTVTNITAGTTPAWADVGGVATLNLGDLEAGASIVLTYDYISGTADIGESINNTASVSGTLNPTPDYPNGALVSDVDTAAIDVVATPLSRAGLALSKTVQNLTKGGSVANLAMGNPGDIFRFTIIVSNTGSLELVDVVLTDNKAVVGSTVNNVTAGTTTTWQAGVGGIATLHIDSLAPGASITYSYDYTSTTADLAAVVNNIALVEAKVGITLEDPNVLSVSRQSTASILLDEEIPLTGETDANALIGLYLLFGAAAIALFRRRKTAHDVTPDQK